MKNEKLKNKNKKGGSRREEAGKSTKSNSPFSSLLSPSCAGFILVNKKAGITSFEALRDIKRELGTRKVGHTGTLDKFAHGLLIALTGKALKLTPWFLHLDKQYIGTIRFGEETDTLDPEGQVIAKAPPPSRELVQGVLSQFTGNIMQTPPAYSALHIDGKRASELVRAGVTPEMKSRPVTIYKLELKSWNPPFAEVFVHCSSGTYIRSLARDIALAAGSRGHLVELLRTRIGEFMLEEALVGNGEWGDALRLGNGCGCSPSAPENPLPTHNSLLPISREIIGKLNLPIIEVTAQDAQKIRCGKPLDKILDKSVEIRHTRENPCSSITSFAVFCQDELIAIIEKNTSQFKYRTVL